ncbi:hypothetical protein HDU88_007084 [Geranomyces variabilis]|nr:hypothetical protein HDU88_007084 [Geranomyces variabilis]
MYAAEPPKGPLEHYKILSSKAGVRVSPACLGAMTFGTAWKERLGECSKDEAFAIMDTFFDNGGNFIDTANNYQNNESEIWIGEWMKKRNNRDEIVLATKFSSTYVKPGEVKIAINATGNSAKSLHGSIARSLKNLNTTYVDILYVHWPDYLVNIHEMMHSLNNLVVAGKVLYLGASDMPAWMVAAANTYAREKGLAQFVVYQGKWNVAERDFERDILPMARAFGLALAPWSVMIGGRSKTEEEKSKDKGREPMGPPPRNFDAVLKAVDAVAKDLSATRQQVCIAYVIKKEPQTFPIIGTRKASHLLDNIKGIELVEKLTSDHVKQIESAGDFDIGFPHNFVGTGVVASNWILTNGGKIQQPQFPIPQI